MIRVVKRNGRVEKLDISKIQKFTSKAVEGLKNVSQSELEIDAKLHFYDMIPTSEIQTALIKTAVDKIDIDRPDWTFVAARLFLYDLYHKVAGFTGYPHLKEYFERGEKEGRILKGLKEKYDLDDLNNYIKPERDLQFTYLGIKTLYDRYLIKDKENNPIELPQHLFMGVAMFLAQNEFDCQSWAKKFYDILSKFEVMAATPTLSNARTTRHQLSSCFPKGQRVFTYDGYKNIEDIKEGDFVLTHKNRFKRVYELLQRDYTKELFTFDVAGLERETIRCTEEHPILTIKADEVECIRKGKLCIINQGNYKQCFRVEGEYKNDCELLNRDFSDVAKWIEAQNIKKGDFVQISFPTYTHKKEQILVSDFVKLKGLEVVDGKIMIKRESCGYEYYSRSFYNNQISPINNQIALDDDFMRLIGYYLAEGYTSSDLSSIHFTFGSKEREFIQDCSLLLEKIFDVKVLIKEKNDNSTVISVHSKLLGEFIYALAGSGFNKKYLNETLFYAKNQKHILVGAFRGDSCTIENGIALSLSNYDLIKQLYTIALREGLTPKIREPKPSKLAKEKPYILEIQYLNDKEFIELVGKDLHKITVKESQKDGTPVGRAINQFWFDGNFFAKVKDITTKTTDEKVYNLEVEDDHSYVVNSVAVHNCYIGSTPDNIEGIFDGYKEMALLSKFGGGIGWDWTKVRAMGSSISGHKRAAGGIVPFLKIANDVAIAVDQLGTRKGAIAVYIEPWHMDVREFIELKKNSGEERRRAHDLFPALWINDIFMRRVQEDSHWTLFDPYEVPELTELYGEEFEKRYIELESDESITKEVVSAKALWKEILRNYFETGNPFLTFKDSANRANPNRHSGIIRSSNLCVTGDTRLATQFGLVRADELEQMNKKIYATYDYRTNGDRRDYGVGVAECIQMYKTKESADIYKITTKDGYEIKSTNWHEYYVLRDKAILKLPLKDVKVTDKLLIQSDIGQFGKEGYYELGLVAGFIAGDGSFARNRANHQIAMVDLYNEDIILKDLIKESLKKIIDRDYLTLPNPKKAGIKNIMPKEFNHTKNSKKIRFANARVGRVLEEKYNFKKETKLKVPEFIYKGKRETVVGYLQGLFTSDSTINIIKNDGIPTFVIQLASVSREFLQEIQILLSNFGIRSKISKMKRDNSFEYTTKNGQRKVYKSGELFRLNINGRNATNFISLIGLLGKKQKKALKVLREREKREYSQISRKQEYFEVDIKSIEYVGKEDVYDTTQLINHSLIFNGIVTGNCTEIFQNTSPNHYKIKVVFEDFSEATFEEEEIVKLDNGIKKEAKFITALDSINGKKIWIVDKAKIDGETAVCNLASVNLSKINTDEDIARVVPIAIRMLDNVIDLNFYPVAKVKKTNLSNRAIGLGVMGEAQMLAERKIEWGSNEHLRKIDEIMEAISFYAIKTSSDLALEKGKYPLFEGSDWSKGIFPIDKANEDACKLVDRGGIFGYKYDWDSLRKKVKKDGMRNGYLMAIAPTSSISILTGTTQAIEPIFKKKWYEKNLSGMIPVVAPNLSAETWGYYVSGYELDQRVLVKAAAVRQKWIDQGQSLNIFIALDKASGRYLNNIYMDAWKFGLKSTYYLRSQSPEEIKSTESVEDRSMECVGCQ